MSAPSSVFVTFHENGSPAVVSEHRDEAEAQNGQPATEYVSLGVHEAEVTRLRAALAEIAALQTEEPIDLGYRHGAQRAEVYDAGKSHGRGVGQHLASEMARKATVGS